MKIESGKLKILRIYCFTALSESVKLWLKGLRNFLIYSDGFIPNSLLNCIRKYFKSFIPISKATWFTLELVLINNSAAFLSLIKRIKLLADWPDISLIFL